MGNKVSTLVGEDAEVKKFNMFAPSDVREWSIYFKNKYPSRKMILDDFIYIYKFYFNENAKNDILESFCTQLFNTINISESGEIDFNELMIGFSALVKGSFLEKVRWLFRFYDINRDGEISRDEFVESYRLIQGISGVMSDEDTINTIFNNKESLTFSDFELLCKNNNNFTKISTFNITQ